MRKRFSILPPPPRVLLLTLSVALALGLLIAAVVPLLASVNSQSFPPHIVQGSASLLGQTVDEGTVVRAWTSVEQVAEAPVDADGNYRLSVPVDASSAGQVIGFTVGNYVINWGRVTLAVDGDTTLNANGCAQPCPAPATRTVSKPRLRASPARLRHHSHRLQFSRQDLPFL